MSKAMSYLKNMEIFETKRALQMSAFLKNTVKPNYEINVCSISGFYFFFIIIYYINKTAVKYFIWLLDHQWPTDHSLEICALKYSC